MEVSDSEAVYSFKGTYGQLNTQSERLSPLQSGELESILSSIGVK